MSPFQQGIKALDPSILGILDIANVSRCSLYVRAQHEKTQATYHKPKLSGAQRDPQCDENLLFQSASLFKIFIAASIALMVEKLSEDQSEGNRYRKLKGAWNEPFTVVYNRFINDDRYKMQRLPWDPSLLQVLVHYNGVYDMNHLLAAPDATPLEHIDDVLNRISHYAQSARETEKEENSGTAYSNANYVLLALLVEKASGSLNGFIEEYILKPFKMHRTFLNLEDLYLRSSEDQRQPHVVSSDRSRRVFRPGETLGLADLIDLAWLGPYISAADLGRFFEGLQSGLDGNPVATSLFDQKVVECLGCGRGGIDIETGYTLCGMNTTLSSTWPGSHSLNRKLSPESDLIDHVLGKTSKELEISGFYLAGSATGWASTVYFIPNNHVLLIVLTDTSGPLDASDLISKLCLQEILDLRPPKIGTWGSSRYHLRRNVTFSAAQYRAYFVELAARMFKENALTLQQIEHDDADPKILTSACKELVGTYFCSSNGQRLHIMDWKESKTANAAGVPRVVIQSGPKRSQKMGLAMKGKNFKICSTPTLPVLAIDRIAAWNNLLFEVKRDGGRVQSVSRQGLYRNDVFIRRELSET